MPKREGKTVEMAGKKSTENESSDDGIEGSLWRTEYSEDAFVSIQRRDEMEQKWVTHGRLSPEDAEQEQVAARFGGGTYRVQLRDKTREGKVIQVEAHIYKVPGRYRPPEFLPGIPNPLETTLERKPEVVAPTGGTSVNDIMGAGILQLFQAASAQQQMMMQMFSAAQQSQAALLQAVLKGDNSKSPDITAIITAISPIVTKFMEKPKEERDPLEMLKAVGEIIRANTGKQSDVADTIAAMRDLLEMKEMLSPQASGTGDPLVDSLPKLVEIIVEEQELRKRAAAANAQRQITPGTPTPPLTAGEPVPVWKRVLKVEAVRLVSSAQAGRNPEIIAGAAVEFMPAQLKGAITEFFHRDEAAVTNDIVGEIPALKEFPQWVHDFVEHAQFLLFPDEFDAAEETIAKEPETAE